MANQDERNKSLSDTIQVPMAHGALTRSHAHAGHNSDATGQCSARMRRRLWPGYRSARPLTTRTDTHTRARQHTAPRVPPLEAPPPRAPSAREVARSGGGEGGAAGRVSPVSERPSEGSITRPGHFPPGIARGAAADAARRDSAHSARRCANPGAGRLIGNPLSTTGRICGAL